MADARRWSGLWVRALACAGLLTGHWLAYTVVRPDPHARAHLLEATGHGYWPVAVTIAVALAVAGLAGQIVARLHAPGTERRGWRTLRALTVAQVGGFAALEVAERAFAGTHGGRLLVLVLVVGTLTQMLVAAALATLARLIVRAVVRLIRAARSRSRRRAASPPFVHHRAPSLPNQRELSGPRATRGPPALSPS